MRPEVDLDILKENLTDFAKSPYFHRNQMEFIEKLLDVLEHVQNNIGTYNDDVVSSFINQLWSCQRYLLGSQSNEIPYEMQFCLSIAIKDWISKECIVTTALLDEKNFHLYSTNIWDFVEKAITGYDPKNYTPILIQIVLPRVYKYKPTFCAPLYHELGHFIDFYFKITEVSLLLCPPQIMAGHPQLTPQQLYAVHQRHRQEFFADLFASCYCGDTLNQSLQIISPGRTASVTHPSTADRVSVVDDFLSGRQNLIVNMFQTCLRQLQMPPLSIRFDKPNVSECFNDVRPVVIPNDRELHGFFNAAWNYLNEAIEKRTAPWISASMKPAEIENIVNNLVEKSIRNYNVRVRWKDVVTK